MGPTIVHCHQALSNKLQASTYAQRRSHAQTAGELREPRLLFEMACHELNSAFQSSLAAQYIAAALGASGHWVGASLALARIKLVASETFMG